MLRIGQTVQYTNTSGLKKAAIVIATPEESTPGTELPIPSEGFVHIVMYGFSDPAHPWIPRADIPLRETAEAIPDYTIEGVLVGYVEAV